MSGSRPIKMACRLPESVTIRFDCTRDEKGVRRFALLPDLESALPMVGLVGHRIRIDRGEAASSLPLTFDEFRLLGEYIQHTREFIGATRKFEQTLHIPRTACQSGEQEDLNILPTGIGLDVGGQGRPWTIRQFCAEGRELLQNATGSRLTQKNIFLAGLMAGARRAPLHDAEPEDLVSYVRTLLFTEPDESAPVTNEVFEYVAGQVRTIIHERCAGTREEFVTRTQNRKGDMVGRISKHHDCPTDRAGVRKAILELGKLGLEVEAVFVHTFMQAFRDALPEPLMGCEIDLFDSLYLSQPRFGGYPLAMLHHRLPFLKLAILALWESPDDPHEVAVFHRLISYFYDLLEKRRAADRQLKRGRIVSSHTTEDLSANESLLSPRFEVSGLQSDEFRDFIQSMIRRQMGADLEFEEWFSEEFGDEGDSVRIRVICPSENLDRYFRIPKSTLPASVRRFVADRVHGMG